MASIRIGGTDYLLTDDQASNPALKVEKDGSTWYGFLSSTQPTTPTIQVGSNFLAQPKVAFTIQLSTPLNTKGGTVYSSYLTQIGCFSATWSFSGRVRLDNDVWAEDSGNHGGVYGGGTKIYDIGNQHTRDDGWKNFSGGGTLRVDNGTPVTVSQRMRLTGVGDHFGLTPRTYLEGTLTITGFKLPQ